MHLSGVFGGLGAVWFLPVPHGMYTVGNKDGWMRETLLQAEGEEQQEGGCEGAGGWLLTEGVWVGAKVGKAGSPPPHLLSSHVCGLPCLPFVTRLLIQALPLPLWPARD